MSQAKIQLLIDQGTHINNTSSNNDIAQEILEEINRIGRLFDVTVLLGLITDKVKTFDEKVALQALNILEYLVEKSPNYFIDDINRNRFLNEFARLLSPKYDADKCPAAIKERITLILKSWMIKFPDKSKIVIAYKALKSRDYLINPDTKSKNMKEETLGDEKSNKKLHALLRSSDPKDLMLANRLIKMMVRREERRSLNIFSRKQKIENAKENIQLLKDLIESIRTGTDVDFSTVNEVKITCDEFYKSLNLTADQAIAENDPFIGDLTKLADNYTSVLQDFENCKNLMDSNKKTSDKLGTAKNVTGDLLDLMDLDFSSTNNVSHPTVNRQKTDEDFLDIFSASPVPAINKNAYNQQQPNIFDSGFNFMSTPAYNAFDSSNTINFVAQTTAPPLVSNLFQNMNPQQTNFSTNLQSKQAQMPDLFMTSFNSINESYIKTVNIDLNDINIVKTEPIANSHFTLCMAKGLIKQDSTSKLDQTKANIYLITILNMSAFDYSNFSVSITPISQGEIRVFPLTTTNLKGYNPILPPSTLNILFLANKITQNINVTITFMKNGVETVETYSFLLSKLD